MSTQILERSSTSHEGFYQGTEITQHAVSQEDRKADKGIRGTFRTAGEVTGHILAALTGLAVFKFTGLYDAMDSLAGQIVVGSVIVYWNVIMFRLGLYSK